MAKAVNALELVIPSVENYLHRSATLTYREHCTLCKDFGVEQLSYDEFVVVVSTRLDLRVEYMRIGVGKFEAAFKEWTDAGFNPAKEQYVRTAVWLKPDEWRVVKFPGETVETELRLMIELMDWRGEIYHRSPKNVDKDLAKYLSFVGCAELSGFDASSVAHRKHSVELVTEYTPKTIRENGVDKSTHERRLLNYRGSYIEYESGPSNLAMAVAQNLSVSAD